MSNPLESWKREHFRRIAGELREAGIEIRVENIDLILKETSFERRREKYAGKKVCSYFDGETEKERCHDILDLNCLLCACPNYLSEREEGGCSIESRFGIFYEPVNLSAGRVWDCSACDVNHSYKEARALLEKNIDFLASFQE